MRELTQLTERLAAAVAGADVNDLPALGDIHSQLEDLCSHAREMPEQQGAKTIGHTAADAKRLLEQIILRESADAAKSLADVRQTVIHLQEMVRRAVEGVCEAPGTDSAEEQAAPGETAQGNDKGTPITSETGGDAASLPETGETTISADDAPLVAEFIGEARGHIESAEAAVLSVEEHPDDIEAINTIFRAFHTIKGVAGFLNLKQIGSLAHAAESLLDLGRKGELKLVGQAVDVILESIDLMKALIAGLEEAMKLGKAVAPHEQVPGLLRQLGACVAGGNADPSPCVSIGGVAAPEAARSEAAGGSISTSGGSSGGDASVKVATTRLDSLINMIGELVVTESMVRQDLAGSVGSNQRIARNIAQLGKTTRALQELSMSMRMVPIQGVFQKMARLVRDLARKAGKEIEYTTTGGDTELDRNVVEAMGDPLVHMIRNSVDHGIESPDERDRNGKERVGHVHLKAWHQAGNILVQISDDGRGLDKNRIRKKAIEAGVVREDQELSEQDIFRLIFHAGLSTAEKVTDVSGRGVGMDVVRQNIEALHGRIDIQSVAGKGTTFTIHLPLTLAVIDGLIVKVGAERYILPLTSVEQSIRPTPQQLSTAQERGEMCLVREHLLPLYRLHRLFAVNAAIEEATQALVVIVQDGTRRCGLLVDELLGQQQVVIKSLGEGIGRVKGISGGAILGDGNVSLILDVPGLMDAALQQ